MISFSRLLLLVISYLTNSSDAHPTRDVPKLERVDVHAHAITPSYRQYLIENGQSKPDGIPQIPAWTAEAHIELMEELNISKSILSISSPGTYLDPNNSTAATSNTRQFNEELSAICSDHPDHFRFFASLPIPSVSDSILEIDHALDNLGAAGFMLLSNTNGFYLGDASLDPIFAKLNERSATVFIHPTVCNIRVPTASAPQVTSGNPLQQFANPMMEFQFDETRAVYNLMLSGTVQKYTNITFVMSHCGCVLPPLLSRVGAFGALLSGTEDKSAEFRNLARTRFFFDLAGVPFPDQIHGLLRMLGEGAASRLLYGSDYPFTPKGSAIKLAADMDTGVQPLFKPKELKAVYSGNAEQLFGLSSGEK